MGLFQKFEDKSVFENIDPQLLDKMDSWFVTYRSRVIVYSNEKLKKSTYETCKRKEKTSVRSS